MLKEGSAAPAFTLVASSGEKVKLSDFKKQYLVLYFYPRDNTPGCTTQANDFQAAAAALKKLGATVVGVSKDSIESHCRFADKFGLKFPLLSDPEGTVIEQYGAWGEKNLYGKKTQGLIRTTVIIDPAGKVARVFPSVKVKGHVDEVIEAIRELRAEAAS